MHKQEMLSQRSSWSSNLRLPALRALLEGGLLAMQVMPFQAQALANLGDSSRRELKLVSRFLDSMVQGQKRGELTVPLGQGPEKQRPVEPKGRGIRRRRDRVVLEALLVNVERVLAFHGDVDLVGRAA